VSAPEELERENARLRARLAALEAELVDVTARANAAIAAAEDRAYWLDRWRLDLNALMASRGGRALSSAVGVARTLRDRARG